MLFNKILLLRMLIHLTGRTSSLTLIAVTSDEVLYFLNFLIRVRSALAAVCCFLNWSPHSKQRLFRLESAVNLSC